MTGRADKSGTGRRAGSIHGAGVRLGRKWAENNSINSSCTPVPENKMITRNTSGRPEMSSHLSSCKRAWLVKIHLQHKKLHPDQPLQAHTKTKGQEGNRVGRQLITNLKDIPVRTVI